jgi:hypothetical protein
MACGVVSSPVRPEPIALYRWINHSLPFMVEDTASMVIIPWNNLIHQRRRKKHGEEKGQGIWFEARVVTHREA